MWKCPKCRAMVADTADECPLCSSSPHAPGPSQLERRPAVTPSQAQEPTFEEEDARDEEGYTRAERMKRRPMREIANSHLISVQKARQRDKRRRRKPGPFTDAVVPGTLRTSRPIFFKTVKH